ncbi:MAG: acetylesterase [Lachnospiraceae bacterium]|nr:acetylesterase [Lachnospiraceae bacterium]
MALASVNFFSISLMRNVSVNVIIPVDKYGHDGSLKAERKPFKTLYLLHGIFGDYTDWVNGTRILSWASAKNLAVVMPSGDNHFYVDGPVGYGDRYSEFIGKELVEITRAMFPLSDKREDTFIGGLSMGGYGAMMNGLKYNDVFGSIISLSGALVTDRMNDSTDDVDGIIGRRSYYESVFGDLSKVEGSDRDCFALVKMLKERDISFPGIYIACGTEDSLLDANRSFMRLLKENDIEVTYVEAPGAHTWEFWDKYIHEALNWLVPEEGSEGVSSGNVQ